MTLAFVANPDLITEGPPSVPPKKITTDSRLVRDALVLAGNIRKLYQDWLSEKTKIDSAFDVSDASRSSMRKQWAVKVMAEYDTKYKGDARIIHDKLLKRLPAGSEDFSLRAMYENEVNPELLETIASNLEHLAKLLHDQAAAASKPSPATQPTFPILTYQTGPGPAPSGISDGVSSVSKGPRKNKFTV